MSKKLEKVCTTLNDIEYLLILASVVTGSGSISTFSSSVGIPIDIVSSVVWFKIWAITAGIKKVQINN